MVKSHISEMGAIYKCNQKTMHPPGYHYNSFVATHAHYVRFAMVVYKYIYIYTHIYIYIYIHIYIIYKSANIAANIWTTLRSVFTYLILV